MPTSSPPSGETHGSPGEREGQLTRGGGNGAIRRWDVSIHTAGGTAGGGSGVARAHANWIGANGTRKPVWLGKTDAATAFEAPDSTQPLVSRRPGTYEREREERGLVLHYLRAATTSLQPSQNVASTDQGGRAPTPSPSDSEGTTAAALLMAMRERPWEGRPNAGSSHEWSEWLEHLEPTLERHLRWLTVDGLAARSTREGSEFRERGSGEARFSAVLPADGEEVAGAGGHASAGKQTWLSAGGNAAAAAPPGARDVGWPAGAKGGGSCVLTGQARIMKSRPIKMVKPWR